MLDNKTKKYVLLLILFALIIFIFSEFIIFYTDFFFKMDAFSKHLEWLLVEGKINTEITTEIEKPALVASILFFFFVFLILIL